MAGRARTSVKGVKGNQALARLKDQLRRLPVTVAHDAAREAAPLLTRLTRVAFDSGQNVYGEPRGAKYPSKTGAPLTLVDTSYTRDNLRFEQAGTIVRCVLAKPYQRYLIGKYGILPNGGLPVWWDRKLRQIVDAVVQKSAQIAARRAA